jgi:ribonuclease HIII
VHHIASAVERLEQAGLTIAEKKAIPYGQQIIVTDGMKKVNVNIYHGKKGITTVVGGALLPLRQKVSDILGLGEQKVPMPQTRTEFPQHPYGFEDVEDFDYRWIGTDESGKGDCFGPLVVAGVMVDAEVAAQLNKMGVKDSKLLTDARIAQLASEIRKICERRYFELELLPAKYNALYLQLQAEGKNLNHLLAWGHARVLEELLDIAPCRFALADQFANKKYIEERLFAKGRTIMLKQAHRAEQNVAVAAASILARDRFVARLGHMQAKYGTDFPKGASAAVAAAAQKFIDAYGQTALSDVAKLHFKTFAGFL